MAAPYYITNSAASVYQAPSVSGTSVQIGAVLPANATIIAAVFCGHVFNMGVSDNNGNTYAMDATATLATDGDNMAIFRCVHAKIVPNAQPTITVRWSGSGGGTLAVTAYSIPMWPDSIASTNQASTSAPSSGNVTPNYPNEMIFGFVGTTSNNAGTMTVGTGFTQRSNINNAANSNVLSATEEMFVSVATPVAATFSFSGTAEEMATIGIAYRYAGNTTIGIQEVIS